MDLSAFLHMEEGQGEYSYAQNSIAQKMVLNHANPSKEEAVTRLCKSIQGARRVGIADLGCSTGPNALVAWQGLVSMLERVASSCDWAPEYQVFLNDLPSNDFNSVFKELQSQGLDQELSSRCFVNAVAGSFYTRLFPSESIHFVHSSSSLHWLSRVPEGVEKSNDRSVTSIEDAYYQQFQADFATFLKCRSQELVAGGCMVLTMVGRKNDNPKRGLNCFGYLPYLPEVLAQMASEGLIEEEKMDTFNFPLYAPSIAEIESVVNKQGSFSMMGSNEGVYRGFVKGEDRPEMQELIVLIVGSTRSISTSLISNHFGEQLSIDDVFQRFEKVVRDGMALKEIERPVTVTISLTKY